MCGIFCYYGFDAVRKTIDALKFLEYRGYDSTGIAFLQKDEIKISKKLGPPSQANWDNSESYVCIGHTRWATHGGVNIQNAHPHIDCYNKIAVVHNGTIHNYLELKKRLESKGHFFKSQTDTEIIPHLIEENLKYSEDIRDSVIKSLNELEGTYAISILTLHDPEKIIVARNSNPIFIGINSESKSICSDIPTLSLYSNSIIPLEPYEIGFVGNDIEIYNLYNGKKIKRKNIDINPIENKINLGNYKTYTEKEIFDQPKSLIDCLSVPDSEIEPLIDSVLHAKRLYLVGAGTSYHSALIGSYILRDAGIPSEAIQSQEFPYKSIIDNDTLCIFFSQSGTTADTNNAITYASHAKKIGIVNVIGSEMERYVDHVVYTRAGPEIGVASTKNFLNQIYLLNLIFLKICERKSIDIEQTKRDFYQIPEYVEEVLRKEVPDNLILQLTMNDPIFLGSGINYPVALEAALKFKELTYMNAIGYSSGELKHGPLATVFENRNIISINPNDIKTTKINLEQAKSRGAKIINIGKKDEIYDYCINIPNITYSLSPIVSIIPTQLIALKVAEKLGREIDKPRNLAKSVTVE